MITMDDWVTIRTMKKRNPKLGSREIARILGISRNTVKKALSNTVAPEYTREVKINPEIEPFKEYIIMQISQKRLIGSRVLNEIKSKGYKGSRSAYYRFLSALELKEQRTFMPYETKPAEQGQFDWSPYSVVLEGKLAKVFVFNFILGFSRCRIYEASLSDTQSSVLEALENSLEELSGCPYRIQTDNAKCFVTNPSKENFQWNERYLAFCGHYGFKPSRSLPRHPWSKGKVENPFRYLEEHFIKGNTFANFEDFIRRLKDFQHVVNNRLHSVTNQIPSELFIKEQTCLLSLPSYRYVGIKEEVRKVTADCLISFGGSRYSVPSIFALKEVWVKVSKGYMLQVYSSSNRLVAEHKLSVAKSCIIIDKSHYKHHLIERGNWERLTRTFLDNFPEQSWFIEKLLAQKKMSHCYHLTQIVFISEYYPKDVFISTLYACRQYNMYNYGFIKGWLERYAVLSTQPVISTPAAERHNISNLDDIKIKRSLSEYKLF